MKIKISFIKSGLLLLLLPLLAFAHGISEEDKQRMLDGGYLQYVGLGASHMLTGYDHLLFLLGVVFFLSSFKDIVKFVTAFTVGHCITLVFATYFQITWNFWLVDAVIAVSVIYKGFDRPVITIKKLIFLRKKKSSSHGTCNMMSGIQTI